MANISITDATSAQFNLSLATPVSFGLQPASAIRFAQDNVIALLDKTIRRVGRMFVMIGAEPNTGWPTVHSLSTRRVS